MAKLSSGRGSGYGQSKPRWHISNVFTNLDIFGVEVPGFNFKGETKVNTTLGGVFTSCIILCTLAYSAIKMNELIAGDNPSIVEFFVPDHYSKQQRVRPGDFGFRIAFSVEGYQDQRRKDDPRYTKWLTRLYGTQGGQEFEKVLQYHDCDEKDYAQFYPAASKAESRLEAIRSSEERGLICIDWGEDIELYGEEGNADYQRFEIVLVPCNYLHQELGYKGDSISPECIADMAQQQEYLGPLNVLLFFNDEEFDQQHFGEQTIKQQGQLRNIQISQETPVWINF